MVKLKRRKMTELRKSPYENYEEVNPKKSENFYSMIKMKNNLAQNNNIIPNLLANTKLFAPINPYEDRPFFRKWEKVDTIYRDNSEIEIHKAYEQLDQNDLTAYLTLLKLARPNLEAVFTRYEFLKLMGLPDTGASYAWFHDFLYRISGTRISVSRKDLSNKRKLTFWGSFVYDIFSEKDERTKTNYLGMQLSKPIVALLEEENWSIISMEERLSLRRNQTALSVHAFLSTNKPPKNGLWIKKDYLRDYWGRSYKNNGRFMEKFRARVIKPLGEIGFIKSFEENKDAIKLKWKK